MESSSSTESPARSIVLAKRILGVLFVCVLILSTGVGFASHAQPLPASVPAQTSSASWNPDVPCNAAIVKTTDITDNLTGTSSYNSSPFSPGITENPPISGSAGAKRWLTPVATPPGWVSPGPSCTITDLQGQTVASFVEIDNVRITSTYYTETDCATSYDPINGGGTYATHANQCDITANIYSGSTSTCNSATDAGCLSRIHTEFDKDWQGARYCGSGTVCDPAQAQSQIVAGSTYIDVQGFVFWDPDHLTSSWHSFSGWELHPLTGWRFHQSSPPDYSITASPASLSTTQGGSTTSTITATSLNGFAGTVTLATSVSPTGPSVALTPTTLTLSSGGSASSILNISVGSTVATGSYSIVVTGTNSGTSHTTSVSLTVTSAPAKDFSISVSPSTLSLQQGSSGTSSITVTSLNGFTGTTTIGGTVSPAGPSLSLNPTSLTLSSGGSATSVLNVTAGTTVSPGSYTVTVNGTSGSLSHTTSISLTVTVRGDFSISASPSSLTLAPGGSTTSQISLTSLNGFSGSVTLSVTSSSARLKASLSAGTASVGSGSTATSTLSVSAKAKLAPGTYTVMVTAKSGAITHSTTITVIIS